MAWYNGRWLEREQRREAISLLRLGIDKLKAKLNDGSIEVEESDRLREYLHDYKRLRRVHRAELDLNYMGHEYFGEMYNPNNPGNWIPSPIDQSPEFHHELCNIMNVISSEKINEKIAWAAPRGHAKSSWLSKTFPLHQIVFRKRKYIILISETPSIAKANIEWIGDQLKYNQKLREDFGPLLSPKKGQNDKDNEGEFIAWEPTPDGGKRSICKVEVYSTGQSIRGTNWNATRPDLIIADDLEDPKTNASTPEQRAKLRDWFTQSVMALGDPEGKKTAVIYMGTIVCHGSLLQTVIQHRSDFKSRLFKAVVKFPVRMDLWEECRKIYQSKENINCADDARSFYEANREEMDRGVVVLWPQVKSIWQLMTWRWDNGSKAFNTEMQNDPIDEDAQIFKTDQFYYWTDAEPNREFPPDEYDFYMGVDFAMGKKRGDFSACIVIAKHKTTGVMYVVDAFVERVHPDKYIDVIADMVVKWQPAGVAAEAQMAQEFFVHKLKEELERRGYPAGTRVQEIHQRARKEIRIEALLPDIQNTMIRFHRRHMELLHQFERYGSGYHDDAPDALEMAVSISKSAPKPVGFAIMPDFAAIFG
ncbi:phage terminase large subunit [Brevibacillus sp. HD3.3A]|uniref:phage terminase large subunit n=1 Tax=Brevibacillus sp. HD3.3A TaxID=2738979 RepID=UPI00156B48D2|nr:phage terminase large subunit [Brevibacillus sp. HD3.3A]UED72146.1 phage terminase large subunit [Brevibacillus sp. HD3.3A]